MKDACEVCQKNEGSETKFSFVFVFSSADEKRDWVRNIKQLVKEYQKKEAMQRKELMEKEAKEAQERREEGTRTRFGVTISLPHVLYV